MAIKMNTPQIKPGLIRRILLRIPFVRHFMIRKTLQEHIDDAKLIGLINKSYSYIIAPNIVYLYNDGKIDKDAMCNVAYHRNILTQLFGKKSTKIVAEIKIEKASIRYAPNTIIYLIKPPSTKEIGQNDIIAFVINPENKAFFYTWEWSIKGTRVICTYSENKDRLSWGYCDDKILFVKRIAELGQTGDKRASDSTDFDEMDLKHRLAKEIGVRVNMLDFYMSKFQEKVTMEMNGIDSAGIDDDIEDTDEWMRYCMWEIDQAKRRMSDKELAQARSLFLDIINKSKA